MTDKITVIGAVPYPTALPGGRHLSPGEIANILDSPEVRSLEKLGLLRVVPSHIETEPTQTTSKKTSPTATLPKESE